MKWWIRSEGPSAVVKVTFDTVRIVTPRFCRERWSIECLEAGRLSAITRF